MLHSFDVRRTADPLAIRSHLSLLHGTPLLLSQLSSDMAVVCLAMTLGADYCIVGVQLRDSGLPIRVRPLCRLQLSAVAVFYILQYAERCLVA